MMKCKKCEEAKKAFLLLHKAGFTDVSAICNKCGTIWTIKKGDE